MVRATGLALWALTAASIGTTTLHARKAERSVLGKKIRQEDVIRVQDARLDRLSKRIDKMRYDESSKCMHHASHGIDAMYWAVYIAVCLCIGGVWPMVLRYCCYDSSLEGVFCTLSFEMIEEPLQRSRVYCSSIQQY